MKDLGPHYRWVAAREGARDALRRPRTQAKRVWFADPLLSSSGAEIERLLEQAEAWAAQLGKPVGLWISDKQKAFVTASPSSLPVPHRYCSNHFLRDLAKPVLDADSHAKVQMRRKVRGLREVERRILEERRKGSSPSASLDEAETAVTPPSATLSASSPVAPASMAPGAMRVEAQEHRPRICRGNPRNPER